MNVAENLFAQDGYRDVTVEDVAKTAGLGTGSFYSCFASKEELYASILDRLEAKATQEAERHVRKFKSPMNQLKALYRFGVLGLRGNPIIRGTVTRDRRYLFPGTEQRATGSGSFMAGMERLIDEILKEGSQKRVFRIRLFQDPRRMLLAVFNTVLLDGDQRGATRLMNDALLLIERGLKRWLRLRRRDERLDRRMMRNDGETSKNTE